eukprot:794967-Prymnesium_polylepis.2
MPRRLELEAHVATAGAQLLQVGQRERRNDHEEDGARELRRHDEDGRDQAEVLRKGALHAVQGQLQERHPVHVHEGERERPAAEAASHRRVARARRAHAEECQQRDGDAAE